jgi:prepilin-type N-terminal cleavage/methylation domain-containing protein/prepilin-type processing-associated H-X9-DG protein
MRDDAPLRTIRKTKRRFAAPGRGFTLIEMLVVLTIIMLLLAILLPALSTVKETTRRMVCSQQVKQVVLALHMYANENDHHLPGSNWISPSWMRNGGSLLSMLGGEAEGLGLFKCPSFDGEYYTPYVGHPYAPPIVIPHDDGGIGAIKNDIVRMQYTYVGGRGDCDRGNLGCLQPEEVFNSDMWKGWTCFGNCASLADPDKPGPALTLDYRSFPAEVGVFTDHMWLWRGPQGPWGTPIHNANWDTLGGDVIPNHTGSRLNRFSGAIRNNWTEGGNVGFMDGHALWRNGKEIKQRRPQAWGSYEPFVCY